MTESLLPPEAIKAAEEGRIEDMVRLCVAAGIDVEIVVSETEDGSPGRVVVVDRTGEEADDGKD